MKLATLTLVGLAACASTQEDARRPAGHEADPQITVIAIEHVNAQDLAATLLRSLDTPIGEAPIFEVAADPRTNSLLISGASSEHLAELKSLLRRLDRAVE